MALIELISRETVKIPLVATTKPEVLRELVEFLYESRRVAEVDRVYSALVAREELGSTGLDGGIAVPHCKSDAVKNLTMAIGISRRGVDFDSLDGKPSQLFFLLVAPPDQTGPHITALAEIAKITKARSFCTMIVAARDADEVVKLFRSE